MAGGRIKNIVILGMLGALLVIAQVSLAFLPNIEVVSLLIIVYTLVLGKWVLAPMFVFILLEGLLYGFGIWWVHYLYVWPLLSLLAYLLRRYQSKYVFALLSSAFGLLFGGLCALTYLFIGSPSSALAYWISGIPFDLLHGAGNAVTTLLLFKPTCRLLQQLMGSEKVA